MDKKQQPQRFFDELRRRLRELQYEVEIQDNGLLGVYHDSDLILSIGPAGATYDTPTPVAAHMREQVYAIKHVAAFTYEYVRAMAEAPLLADVHLDPQDKYQQLIRFADHILAGADNGPYGFSFVTWRLTADGQYVENGEYHGDNYEDAKRDFADRAGLLAGHICISQEDAAAALHAINCRLENAHKLSTRHFLQLSEVRTQMTKQHRFLISRAEEFLPPALDYRYGEQSVYNMKHYVETYTDVEYRAAELKDGNDVTQGFAVTYSGSNGENYILQIGDDSIYETMEELVEEMGSHGLIVNEGRLVLNLSEDLEQYGNTQTSMT